ncbi:MAG: tetratricopeptide repeat protein [Rhodospirillales bacterium]
MMGAHHHWEAAAAALGRVAADDPLSPIVRLHRADYLSRAGHPDQARALLEALTKSFPDQPEGLLAARRPCGRGQGIR